MILSLEELEAYIQYIYSNKPETKYSLKSLVAELRKSHIDNVMNDITLLHADLYHETENNHLFENDIDEPVIDAEFDYGSRDSTKILAQLYGGDEELSNFYQPGLYKKN